MSGRHSSSKRPSKLRLWTSSNVVGGFRKAGIHPFNDKAIAIPVNGEAVSHHNAENCSQEPSEIIDFPSTPTVKDHGMGGSLMKHPLVNQRLLSHQQKCSCISIELMKATISLLTSGIYSG